MQTQEEILSTVEPDLVSQGKAYWDSSITLSQAAQQYHRSAGLRCPYENNPVDITIFVSCYNEEDFILDTLNTVVESLKQVGRSYEILVIDDCSKDRSLEIINQFIQQNPDVPIILRANKKNRGWAQNYIDGAFIGKGKYYRVICGDNSEPVETMVKIFSLIGQADMIVPYYTEFRFKSVYRQLLSKIYTRIINFLSKNKFHYYNGLQIHLRHNVMRWHPTTRGFGFQAALLCTFVDLGFTYKEVACITIERRGGRGNAVTFKNLRSVAHTMLSVLMRRLAP